MAALLLLTLTSIANASPREDTNSTWPAATLETYGEGTSSNPCQGSPQPSNVYPAGLCCSEYNLSVLATNASLAIYFGTVKCDNTPLVTFTPTCLGVPIGVAEMGIQLGSAKLPPGPPRCPNATSTMLPVLLRAAKQRSDKAASSLQ